MINIEFKAFLRLLKGKLGAIVLFSLIISLISFYAFIFSQKRYQVKTDILIAKSQDNNQDFYTASKEIEYMEGVLAEAIYSSALIGELKNEESLESFYFSVDEAEALDDWKKTIQVERSANLGSMKVRVYDDNKSNALALAESVNNILVNRNYLFGGKSGVEVKILSGPIIQKNPDIKSVILVVLGGFIIGFMLNVLYLYLNFLNRILKVEEDEEYLKSLREIE